MGHNKLVRAFILALLAWPCAIVLCQSPANADNSPQCSSEDVECRAKVARDMGNPDICAAPGASRVAECYTALALLTGDPVMCDKMSSPSPSSNDIYQSNCIQVLATKKKDPSLCNRIHSSTPYGTKLYQYTCLASAYDAVAQDSTDIEPCKKEDYYRHNGGTSGAFIGYCYGTVAKNARNPRICDPLAGFDKTVCQQTIANSEHNCALIEDAKARTACEGTH